MKQTKFKIGDRVRHISSEVRWGEGTVVENGPWPFVGDITVKFDNEEHPSTMLSKFLMNVSPTGREIREKIDARTHNRG